MFGERVLIDNTVDLVAPSWTVELHISQAGRRTSKCGPDIKSRSAGREDLQWCTSATAEEALMIST